MVVKQRMTVAEYLALPEEKPYLEYVNGEVVAKPVPSKNHIGVAGEVVGRLYLYKAAFSGFMGPEGRSEFADPDDHRLLVPDVSFWRAGHDVGQGSRMTPPTLAVEVRSPEQSMTELREKCRYYLSHGVETAWLIDPERRTAEVFEAGAEPYSVSAGESLTASALPGLTVPVSELWAVLDA